MAATQRTTSERGVAVIEPPLPRHVRRPADAVRLIVATVLLVVVLAIGSLAVGTAAGLEQDLLGAATGLPRLILSVVTFVSGVGTLALPVAVSIDLIVRRRIWQLLDALVAATIAVVVALGFRYWVVNYQPSRLLEALTKVLPDGSRSLPVQTLLVGVVAFLTLADLSGRPALRGAAAVFVGSVATTGVLSGDVTVLATGFSLLLGWVIGLLVRTLLGAASTRPSGRRVAEALLDSSIPVRKLERIVVDSIEPRRYLATVRYPDGHDDTVRVNVLDRDTYGSNLFSRAWRLLRLQGPATRRGFYTVRSAVDHAALMALAVRQAGVATPELMAVAEVGPYAALVALRHLDGVLLSDVPMTSDRETTPPEPPPEPPPGTPPEAAPAGDGEAPTGGHVGDTVILPVQDELLDDARLEAAWRALKSLQDRRLAHRGLSEESLLLTPDGGVALINVSGGEVAAGDLPLRLDTAQLLTTLALRVGAERAVSTAHAVLGAQELVRALPLLQRIAMARPTRSALRGDKRLLHDLRERILAVVPEDTSVEEVKLERVSWRTVIATIGLVVAAYVIVTQLAQVDLGSVIRAADWRWAAVALGLSMVTYAGAAMTVVGFVTQKINFFKAVLTQFAVSFTGLVAPTAVGTVALNARFLQRQGVEPAVAVGSVGLAQLAMFVSHLLLLVLFGVLAGTGPQASFSPPQGAVIAVLVVVLIALIGLSVPAGRRLLVARVRPLVSQVVPRIVAVFQHPARLATGLGGALILNLAYVLCLDASTRAFGGQLPLPAVAVVYLAGAVVGSAVPTPGGLGGVEAAMSAGLTAAGLNGATAISAVLLYRLVTFWLPIPVGWLSLTGLQRSGDL